MKNRLYKTIDRTLKRGNDGALNSFVGMIRDELPVSSSTNKEKVKEQVLASIANRPQKITSSEPEHVSSSKNYKKSSIIIAIIVACTLASSASYASYYYWNEVQDDPMLEERGTLPLIIEKVQTDVEEIFKKKSTMPIPDDNAKLETPPNNLSDNNEASEDSEGVENDENQEVKNTNKKENKKIKNDAKLEEEKKDNSTIEDSPEIVEENKEETNDINEDSIIADTPSLDENNEKDNQTEPAIKNEVDSDDTIKEDEQKVEIPESNEPNEIDETNEEDIKEDTMKIENSPALEIKPFNKLGVIEETTTIEKEDAVINKAEIIINKKNFLQQNLSKEDLQKIINKIGN
ncbi:MAG: hypothetical protein Q8P90_00235 [bacterium]|nr:hypothetical protein [bacterium]